MNIAHSRSWDVGMKQIAAATLKKQCLSLLNEENAEGIVTTKGGKPAAKLIPTGPDSASLASSVDDRIKIPGKAARRFRPVKNGDADGLVPRSSRAPGPARGRTQACVDSAAASQPSRPVTPPVITHG
jgi:antitoxin (DNA-binding transcriptional repressor) of toxin-antitoxin stability system